VATLLALCASLLWGSSDFLGGTTARRLPATAVVWSSQAVALIGLLVVATATTSFTTGSYLGWGIAAALVGVVGLVSFYAALASGTMGVVAPIAALGVIVPVIVGIVQGDRPSVLQGLGVAVAIVGVVLASGPKVRDAATGAWRPLALAAVAAAGFGLVFVFIAHGARSSTLMTLLTMRAVSVAVLTPLVVRRGEAVSIGRTDLAVLAAIGAGDVGANACMALATTRGLLSLVAVLSSLYPAVTVVLARAVHDERLVRLQTLGVTGALAGVVLIASGGGLSS
jgi:drug/metabolite transporter (DMT)-like permease